MSDDSSTNKEPNWVEQIKARLGEVSPTFCMAKWLQVTAHLQNGLTHSCHHPVPHKIPLDELKLNFTALHNTSRKKKFRQQMLDGKRPFECDYCWRIEDTPGNQMSDRHLKSNDDWAKPHIDEVKVAPASADINPTYMEVSFSNLCNFKCSYCQPKDSSKWMEEIRTHGAYPTTNRLHNLEELEMMDAVPIPEDHPNPYVDAFWDWWPELSKSLKVFRLTGGEPLLHKNTFRILEDLKSNPLPQLELSINSNLGVPDKLVDRFAELVKDVWFNRKVRELTIFTSVDTWGIQAEYTRHGLSLSQFTRNCHKLLSEVPGIKLTIMCTFNVFSVPGFMGLLQEVLTLREKYCTGEEGSTWIFLDISYLRNPGHQSVKVLPSEFCGYIESYLEFMETNSLTRIGAKIGFHDFEIMKMKRLLAWMRKPVPQDWVDSHQADFYRFFFEHDRRRGTDLVRVFPELADFWALCRSKAPENRDVDLEARCGSSSIQAQT